MNKFKVYLAGIALLSGCASDSTLVNPFEKSDLDHRHPYESEFRPANLPYHERMLREKPEEKEKPLNPKEIERRPSLWSRKLRVNVV